MMGYCHLAGNIAPVLAKVFAFAGFERGAVEPGGIG